MRGLLGIAAVVVILAVGWTKPLKEWVSGPTPKPIEREKTVETVRAPAPSEKLNSGSWMWEKGRKTILDKESYHRDYNVTHSPNIYSTSTARVDSNGNRYWVDQSGGRHYY